MDSQRCIILPKDNRSPTCTNRDFENDEMWMLKTCDSEKCSCHKNDMKCTVDCKNCKGIGCANVENEHYLDDLVGNDINDVIQ